MDFVTYTGRAHEVFTDGSFPNDRKAYSVATVGGWAYVISEVARDSGKEPCRNNIEAELFAVIYGLEAVAKLDPVQVHLYCDHSGICAVLERWRACFYGKPYRGKTHLSNVRRELEGRASNALVTLLENKCGFFVTSSFSAREHGWCHSASRRAIGVERARIKGTLRHAVRQLAGGLCSAPRSEFVCELKTVGMAFFDDEEKRDAFISEQQSHDSRITSTVTHERNGVKTWEVVVFRRKLAPRLTNW